MRDSVSRAYAIFKSPEGTLREYLLASATEMEFRSLEEHKVSEHMIESLARAEKDLAELEATSDEKLAADLKLELQAVLLRNQIIRDTHEHKISRAKSWLKQIRKSPRLKTAISEIGLEPLYLLEHYTTHKLYPSELEELPETDPVKYRQHAVISLQEHISWVKEKIANRKEAKRIVQERLADREIYVNSILDAVADRL